MTGIRLLLAAGLILSVLLVCMVIARRRRLREIDDLRSTIRAIDEEKYKRHGRLFKIPMCPVCLAVPRAGTADSQIDEWRAQHEADHQRNGDCENPYFQPLQS